MTVDKKFKLQSVKIFITSSLILCAFFCVAQKFYVAEEAIGVGAPIKEALLKAMQIVVELPNKADYIVKTEINRNSNAYTRPKMKIMLVDVNTGFSIYETEMTKFSYSASVEAGAEKEAGRLMEKYGSDLILAAKKNYLQSQIKRDSIGKG